VETCGSIPVPTGLVEALEGHSTRNPNNTRRPQSYAGKRSQFHLLGTNSAADAFKDSFLAMKGAKGSNRVDLWSSMARTLSPNQRCAVVLGISLAFTVMFFLIFVGEMKPVIGEW
jgi:hypothetical protein